MDGGVFCGRNLAGLLCNFPVWYCARKRSYPIFIQKTSRHASCNLGVGLILQQIYRQFINPRPVAVPTASWLQGAWEITDIVAFPLSRLFIIGLAVVTGLLVYLLLYKTRAGLLIRSVTQNREISGAVGINQKKVDTYTFALGCGLAGIAGSSFTMLASTAPDTGQAYIVDTFIVVVFGGVESLLGTVFAAFSHRAVPGPLRVFPQWLHGQGADTADGYCGPLLPP